MSAVAERLKPLLDALTTEDRHEVMAYLRGLEPQLTIGPDEWEEAWVAECERRSANLDAGRTVGIPHEEAMARRKEMYG